MQKPTRCRLKFVSALRACVTAPKAKLPPRPCTMTALVRIDVRDDLLLRMETNGFVRTRVRDAAGIHDHLVGHRAPWAAIGYWSGARR